MSGAVVLTKLADLPLQAIEHSPQGMSFSDEAKDRLRQEIDSPAAWIFTMVFSGLRPVVQLLLVSGIYFLIFTILGRQGSFKAFFSITAFSFVPAVFRHIVIVMSAFLVPSSSIIPDELGSLSPAVFLDRDAVPPVLFMAINMIDVVSIWTLSLMVIGFAFVTGKNVSRAARSAVVFGVFLVYALLRTLIRTI